MKNSMKVEFDAISSNESFARMCICAFIASLDPTVEEINDIKTAVSEAVTNSIIHGYGEMGGIITLICETEGKKIFVTVSDSGRGICDVELCMQPLYTEDKTGERSGLGFTVMQTFMDSIDVVSSPGNGCTVHMLKELS